MENSNISQGSIDASVQVALKLFDHYVKYVPTGSTLVYRNEQGEEVVRDIPSIEQISQLAEKICNECRPFQLVNFLSFVEHLAFYFTDANLYELMLIGMANLLNGKQVYYDITDTDSDSTDTEDLIDGISLN